MRFLRLQGVHAQSCSHCPEELSWNMCNFFRHRKNREFTIAWILVCYRKRHFYSHMWHGVMIELLVTVTVANIQYTQSPISWAHCSEVRLSPWLLTTTTDPQKCIDLWKIYYQYHGLCVLRTSDHAIMLTGRKRQSHHTTTSFFGERECFYCKGKYTS